MNGGLFRTTAACQHEINGGLMLCTALQCFVVKVFSGEELGRAKVLLCVVVLWILVEKYESGHG